jgi:hypothetical protein
MHNSNFSQPNESAFKYILVFLLIVLAGGVALGFVIAGILNPKAAAEAREMDDKTEAYKNQVAAEAERPPVDLVTYRQREILKVEIERAEALAQLEYEKEQYAQQLAQAQRDF